MYHSREEVTLGGLGPGPKDLSDCIEQQLCGNLTSIVYSEWFKRHSGRTLLVWQYSYVKIYEVKRVIQETEKLRESTRILRKGWRTIRSRRI